MSDKEIDRYLIIKQVLNKQIRQVKAAELMGLKPRQVRSLIGAVKKEGKKGLISKHRGKPSNRKYKTEFRIYRHHLFGHKFALFSSSSCYSLKSSLLLNLGRQNKVAVLLSK